MATVAEMMEGIERFEAVRAQMDLEPKEIPKWLFFPWIGEEPQTETLKIAKKNNSDYGLGYSQYES